MSPVDQHGAEDQTHGRAGGVRDAQTGTGDRPMIHLRHTYQIAPGRQADSLARVHEWVAIHKQATGTDWRISVVTTGTLGRACVSADFESMGVMEAAGAKANAHPDWIALGAKQSQEERDGTAAWVPGTAHQEIWRDA